MAVLDNVGHIHGDTLSCIQYIQNPEKTVHNDQTANVIRYMQSHCVEAVMSVGYNGTSGNRELAVEQFRLAEASYKASHPARKKQVTRISVEQYLESNHKRKLPKHIKPDADGMITITKEEVTAEHLVLSVHKTDRVTPAKLQAVVNEFMAHPYFQHFPAISNLHWNTDEPHAHILVSNYAADGKRKLSLTGTKKRELQRYLDKICYRHGLSIIDSKGVRLDPEHAAWIDRVKAEGKVKVWPAKNKGQTNWKAADNRAKAEQVERILARGDMSEAKEKQIEYIVKNDLFVGYSDPYFKIKPLCPTWYLDKRRRERLAEEELKRREQWRSYYYVKRRGRSDTILCFFLLGAMLRGEYTYLKTHNSGRAETMKVEVDKTAQCLIDSMEICRQFNVRNPGELTQRRTELGEALGRTKKAIAYDQKTLARTELVEAIEDWAYKTGSVAAQESACDVLDRYGYTDYEKRCKLLERVSGAKRRLSENQTYLTELNKSYRDMSRGISVLTEAQIITETINREARKKLAERMEAVKAIPTKELEKQTKSLDDLLANAATRHKQTPRKQMEKEKEPPR